MVREILETNIYILELVTFSYNLVQENYKNKFIYMTGLDGKESKRKDNTK